MEYVLFHLLERNEKCGPIFRRNTLILVLLVLYIPVGGNGIGIECE